MANAVSVLEIDVRDQRLRDLQELLEQYRRVVAELPDAWKDATAAIAEHANAIDKAVKTTDSLPEVFDKAARSQERFNALSLGSIRSMDLLASGGKHFATSIEQATKNLAGWAFSLSGLGALGIGFGAAGSLFLLDRIMGGAANTQRSALQLGLGANPQAISAFNIAFGTGNLTEPAFLSNIASQQAELGSLSRFSYLGITPAQVQSMDAASLAEQVLIRGRSALQREAPQGTFLANQPVVQQLGALGMSLGSQRALRDMPEEQFQGNVAQFHKLMEQLAVDPAALQKWTELKQTLETAKTQIQHTFIDALVPLTGPLRDLSTALSNLITTMLTSEQMKEAIAGTTSALKDFNIWLKSDAAHKDLEDFRSIIHDFVVAASAMGAALKDVHTFMQGQGKIGQLTEKRAIEGAVVGFMFGGPEGAAIGAAAGAALGAAQGLKEETLPAPPTPLPPGMQPLPPTAPEGTHQPGGNYGPMRPGAYYTWDGRDPMLRSISWDGELPRASGAMPQVSPQLLYAVMMQESGGDPHAVSPMGARGLMQLMPDTAREVGVTNRDDPEQSLRGGSEYLSRQLAEFGDLEEGLAAYNAGAGRVREALRDAAAMHDDWKTHLPRETQNYVASIMRRIGMGGGGPGTTVRIENRTGGSAVVTTSQLSSGLGL